MSGVTITQLYDQLSSKLGTETAENLTSYMEKKIKEEVTDNLKMLATKEDIVALASVTKDDFADVRKEIADLALATKDAIADVRKEISTLALATKGEFATVRKEISDLALSTKEYKSNIIKWMFIFWIGQMAMILGLLHYFVK